MIYDDKQIILKNGEVALFRAPREDDARELLDLLRQTSIETDFLTRYPEECPTDVTWERNFLANQRESANEVMILCECGGKIAGNCSLRFNSKIKSRHRASVGIALLKEFWGRGIGTAMFREMIALAKERGIAQLELEFIEGNERARALYEKMGFRVIGEKPDAFRLKDGTSLKEYCMVKQL